MTFDMAAETPTISVRTYSTHYRKNSSEVAQYVSWYKAQEQPEFSDKEFIASDDFTISLDDFRNRFDERARSK